MKGKDSYFIGKPPMTDEGKSLNETKDLNNDSFLECLDVICRPPKRHMLCYLTSLMRNRITRSFTLLYSILIFLYMTHRKTFIAKPNLRRNANYY